ncbi:MAG: PspC domain-containing protein [Actinomycetota bacterium]|nr:PspC domain-containing protein [Actinomycetota bacterium]
MTSTHTEQRFQWPFYRSTKDRLFGGVGGGIAERLGAPSIYVRAAFICASLAAGLGIVLYLLAALVVPNDPDREDTTHDKASSAQVAGLGLMLVAVMLVFQTIGLWFGPIVWPTTLVIFGLAIAIDTSGLNYEQSLAGIAGAGDMRRSWWLVVGGLVMMVAGLVVVLSSLESLQGMGVLALAVLAAAAGFLIVAGPWLWSLIEDLRTERRARIRSEEKAEMAAHLHDSVLQTLALIQRTDDSKKMVTLARSQERELRSWLFDERAGDVETLRGALAQAASKVEEAHNVPVSVVVVGESSLPSDRQTALVGAATEAMMNAAEHSGAPKVSVFAEVAGGSVDVFITDQGAGFDSAAIDEDRKGIAESIRGRMQRHGGKVHIDSELGIGTEIHLTMSGGIA